MKWVLVLFPLLFGFADEVPVLSSLEGQPLIDRLIAESQVIERGSDDLRVPFVEAQGAIEQALADALASGEIDSLVGVIHTPTPATPLCTRPENDPSGLLDPSIQNDPRKRRTVLSRAEIVRDYLAKGGKLYVVYPRGGLEKRSPEQQKIYRESLEQFPDHLIDTVLSSPLSSDLIGATYLFRAGERPFAFSIKARQANDIQPQAEWGLWFGPLDDSKVAARVDEVFQALSRAGGPDLRK